MWCSPWRRRAQPRRCMERWIQYSESELSTSANAAARSATQVGCCQIIAASLPRGLTRAGSELRLDLSVAPVEPGRERLEIRRLHRGATPDAQARRRLDVGADVVRGTLPIEQA